MAENDDQQGWARPGGEPAGPTADEPLAGDTPVAPGAPPPPPTHQGWAAPTPGAAPTAPPPPPGATAVPMAASPAAPPPTGYALYKPGIIVLRPLNFGELLDGGIKAIRHNPKVMVGLNSLIVLASTVVLFLAGFSFFAEAFTFDPSQNPDDISLGGLGAFYVGAFLATLMLLMVSAVTAVSVGRSVTGAKASIGDAWRGAARRYPAVLGVSLLMSIAGFVGVMALVLLVAAAAAAADVTGAIIVGILATLGGIVLFAWLGIKLSLVIPAAVLEKLGPIKALGRSWRLTGGRFWPILGVLLVTSIITGIIQQVISFPVSLILGLLGSTNPDAAGPALVAVLALTTFLGVLISTVYLAAVTAVVYTDQRMRREGFDLTLARAAQQA